MARYQNKINIARMESGKLHYTSAIPQEQQSEQIQYTYEARIGDRWDKLAYKYLGNASFWYVIARANGGLNGSIFIKPGTVITIPRII